jgi:hypothetical protein
MFLRLSLGQLLEAAIAAPIDLLNSAPMVKVDRENRADGEPHADDRVALRNPGGRSATPSTCLPPAGDDAADASSAEDRMPSGHNAAPRSTRIRHRMESREQLSASEHTSTVTSRERTGLLVQTEHCCADLRR